MTGRSPVAGKEGAGGDAADGVVLALLSISSRKVDRFHLHSCEAGGKMWNPCLEDFANDMAARAREY